MVGTNYAILVDKGNAMPQACDLTVIDDLRDFELCNVIRFPTLFKISSKNRSLPVQCEKLFLARNYCNPISSTTTGEYPGHQWRFIRHTIKPLNCHRSGNLRQYITYQLWWIRHNWYLFRTQPIRLLS